MGMEQLEVTGVTGANVTDYFSHLVNSYTVCRYASSFCKCPCRVVVLGGLQQINYTICFCFIHISMFSVSECNTVYLYVGFAGYFVKAVQQTNVWQT